MRTCPPGMSTVQTWRLARTQINVFSFSVSVKGRKFRQVIFIALPTVVHQLFSQWVKNERAYTCLRFTLHTNPARRDYRCIKHFNWYLIERICLITERAFVNVASVGVRSSLSHKSTTTHNNKAQRYRFAHALHFMCRRSKLTYFYFFTLSRQRFEAEA